MNNKINYRNNNSKYQIDDNDKINYNNNTYFSIYDYDLQRINNYDQYQINNNY